MQFVYNNTAEKGAAKGRLKAVLMLVIGVLIAVVGVLLIMKKQVFPGILVDFVALMIGFFAVLRFAQIKNMISIVKKSKFEVGEERIKGTGFLLKGGLCLPAMMDLSYDDIKSVKAHSPNDGSYDYATIELRAKDEVYYFSVGEPDKAIIEIRLRLTQK